MSATLPLKTNPPPNFFSTYSVVLHVPLRDAYETLGTAAGHERVCRLSKLCSGLELLEKDKVTLPVQNYPEGMTLGDVGVRTASAMAESPDSVKVVTRQHFKLEETVPLLFGTFKTKVLLDGTLTWDDSVLSSSSSTGTDDPVEALYESVSNGGIVVWKLRTFQRVPNEGEGATDQTRVTERIEGWAPALLRFIVQSEATKAHRTHMDSYHTLF
ncbi:hypothetical protein B0H34DRAFT_785290 [Crassisporium funariophilum]|nr:hypothetical protein B0H34DRAFT_785290 [Crassisporium funariophilum]